ncbi:MAG TPA: RNA polymerase sigma factor [Albitalea sp.]|jgi:RNA polymerase sigma-70 factor (ECF subfamily)|nr:RNA polymerase sigma factor [Albitalea sp.]
MHAALPAATDSLDDDARLARSIASGDRAAFTSLMRRCNRRLYRLARAVLRDDAEAEDALQDAYLSAYRSIAGFRGGAALSTWLSRLVINECLARLRRTKRRELLAPTLVGSAEFEVAAMASNDVNNPEQSAGRSEMRRLLQRRLDELPEPFRMVFVLRCVEDLSVEETAQCLDIPEATVRSRHFRARGLLRESLAQDIDLAERDLFEFGGEHCDRLVAAVMARL